MLSLQVGSPAPSRPTRFAACGDRPFERFALRFAEPCLAFITEDIGHGGSRLLLDQRIGIHEADAQPARQLAPEGALAASHVTDQKRGFIAGRSKQVQLFGVDHLVGIAPGAFDLELHPAGNSRSVAGTGIRRPVIRRRRRAGRRESPGIAVVRRFGLGRQFGFDEAQRSDLVGRQALALGRGGS